MQYPYPVYDVSTPQNTVALQANVQAVVNAINTGTIIPYGDYGGPIVFYFTVINAPLGNIAYTTFDRVTHLGLSSYTVRYGAAATINQILFQPFPRTELPLQFLILPQIPLTSYVQGSVIPS